MEATKSRHGSFPESGVRTLAIDIGGTGIKTMVLNDKGTPVTTRKRVRTPRPPIPEAVLKVIEQMGAKQGEFARGSAGFPGVVRDGMIETAPNLCPEWVSFPLAKQLAKRLGKPVRVANDADVQGFGCVTGKGVELVIILGTGLGSALFVDGKLVPNLELAHHPFRKGRTYEESLGKAALHKVSKKQWNKRLGKAILQLRGLFNFDRLYIGGGNAKKVSLKLPPWAEIVPNVAGLWGGIALWHEWKRVEHETDRVARGHYGKGQS
jgi:polyphosphate glucokinase